MASRLARRFSTTTYNPLLLLPSSPLSSSSPIPSFPLQPSVRTLLLFTASVHHAGFPRWLATLAAMYLLAIDGTSWKTDIFTVLLVPYIVLNLPSVLFNFLRGEVGKWFAFLAMIFRLFFQRQYCDVLELPAALIFLLVVLPSPLASLFRDTVVGIIISLIVGASLLYQHIHRTASFRNAFAKKGGIFNTLGILLLFISPLWELVKLFRNTSTSTQGPLNTR